LIKDDDCLLVKVVQAEEAKKTEEKFHKCEPQDLRVVAGDRTIFVDHDGRNAEGTRDDLLAAVRSATSYADLWEVLVNDDKIAIV
jgi:hypothetical protein